MARPDPLLSLLKDIGFLPLRMPRTGVHPLMLVCKDGKELTLLGHLSDITTAGGEGLPPVTPDLAAAGAIETTATSRIDRRVGLQVLANLITGFGGAKPDLSAAFPGAASIRAQFAGVTVDQTPLTLADRYLTRSAIHPESRHVQSLLERGDCALLTAVARCRRYLISAQRSDGADMKLDVPLLQAAGAGVRVQSANAGDTRVLYESPTPVAFGVQAARIFYERGQFTAFRPISPGQAVMRSAPPQPQAEWLTVLGAFADLSDN